MSLINQSAKFTCEEQQWTCGDIATRFGTTVAIPQANRLWAWKPKAGVTLDKRERLVDSVMHGIPIPTCILLQGTDGNFEVYDGRHRMQTISEFHKDDFTWNGRKFSDLCEEDKAVFLGRVIPITVVSGVTSMNQVADMFLRVNSGVPLSDSDMFWAYRDTPLVKFTREWLCENKRLKAAFGNIDLNKRNDLANWVGHVFGLCLGNAGNMTTSFLRISNEVFERRQEAVNEAEGARVMMSMYGKAKAKRKAVAAAAIPIVNIVNGLSYPIAADEAKVKAGIDALCDVLEQANAKFPPAKGEQHGYKKLGKINAFFFHEWLNATAEGKTQESIVTKWVDIIGRIRVERAADKTDMLQALAVNGAQNLNSEKILKVLGQVNTYLANGVVDSGRQIEEEDE
jgi:hypothetical protein